jgi:hypothetical protein
VYTAPSPASVSDRGSAVKPGLLLATLAAASYVVIWRLGERGQGWPAFDVYGYFCPILYALRSLATGSGLWNRYQSCGQPFFAISTVGLLYPANVSGFVGVPGNDATVAARFVTDDPEHVVIELNAPERGFLFLADQYFPGWSATVNGRTGPIVRANHAFRLVEVPRGQVRVEFRYRPTRVWVGAIISVMTLSGVAVALVRSRGRSG